MKTFAKWSISLIWIIILIILILALSFLTVHYDGYYWEGKGLPVNYNDIKTFDGNGYQLIAEIGLGKLMRLVSGGSFIWGYSNYVTINDQTMDLMKWLNQPGSVVNGIIQWPQDYELPVGTNFAAVVGSILIVLLVAIPILTIIGFYVTLKMVKAMIRPYSIEYLDAKKNLHKTIIYRKKALRKGMKAIKKGQAQATDLAKTKEYWTSLLDQAQDVFNKGQELFKIKYSKKPDTEKFHAVIGK